jgi:hypothetical protein
MSAAARSQYRDAAAIGTECRHGTFARQRSRPTRIGTYATECSRVSRLGELLMASLVEVATEQVMVAGLGPVPSPSHYVDCVEHSFH